MIQEHIDKIETTVRSATNLQEETKRELLALLSELKAEVTPLTVTHGEDAASITRLTDASVQEATRTERKPDEAAAAITELSSSVAGFEASHPRLVQIVDRLANTLSNMGI